MNVAALRILVPGLLVAMPLFAPDAHAQNRPETTAPEVEERQERLRGLDLTSDDLALPASPEAVKLDPETESAYQESLRAYYEYRRNGYDHRQAVFEWQAFSTRVIFFTVLGLVLLGVYFAAIQFHVGLRKRSTTEASTDQDVTEFVLSVKEFKVRSPVLGVIVLAISLAFFYLYLVHIYPIVNVF